MNETLETPETPEIPEIGASAPAEPAEPSSNRLGNVLIASGLLVLFLLASGLIIGLWQHGDDDPRRDAERSFVDEYRDAYRDDDYRDEECDIDPSDAEARFAPDCDDWDGDRDRDRNDRNDRDGQPGLFPDE